MSPDSITGNFLRQFLPRSQRRNIKTILESIQAVFTHGRLTITGIARWMKRGATVKSQIKRIDRLVSHPGLHRDFIDIAAKIARKLLPSNSLLIVDWTPYGPHHALVASIPHQGRAIPIYFEVHPEKMLGNATVEQRFLDILEKHIIPKNVKPIVVTDAGYRNPWFKKVLSLGWHVVGRALSRVLAQPCEEEGEVWWHMTVLHDRATNIPTDHGWWRLARRNPMPLRIISLKRLSKRLKSQKRGPSPRGGTTAARHRRRAMQPWMLVTSVAGVSAATVVSWYQQRMWIEEQFRDDKNIDTGIGLNQSRSTSLGNLQGLRMLGQLTTLLTHCVGIVGERLGLQRKYQVNTVTERRGLSLPYLGRQLLFHEDRRQFSLARLNQALNTIRQEAAVSLDTEMEENLLAA